MRIAIDLTSIPSELTGVGWYVKNLLGALSEIDNTNSYFVFVGKNNIHRFKIDKNNFTFIGIVFYLKISRVIWEQCILPLHLLIRKIGILHSPHYTTPLFGWWFKRLVTFPDMTFLLFPEKHIKTKVMFFQWMIKKTSRRADLIVAISESTKRDIIRLLGVPDQGIITTLLAVSPGYERGIIKEELNEVLIKYGLPQKYILYVGTIEPRKNILGLVKAFSMLSDKIRNEYKLVIAGKKGWHYKEIFEYVSVNNLSKNVGFTGYVDEHDLPLLFNGAALFVYPSIYEGFGIPVLEALSCGVPTITSNVSSMPEIAGDAALLVAPNDISAIKSAIEEVLTDPDLARDLCLKGIKQAKKFSWEKCARETLDVYNRLCKIQAGC